jgi:hypothetical protein
VLLDDLLLGWRRQVRGTSDLGDLLASASNRPPTTDVAVAAARYDATTLRTAEEVRERAQQTRVAELRRRFVDRPVLTMPAAGSGTSDSTDAVGIPGAGTVFLRNFTPSAQGTTLQGDGWSVTLNGGWAYNRRRDLGHLLSFATINLRTHAGRRRGAPARRLATTLADVIGWTR